MKLKAAHWWKTDGTIVVQVRDHDALKDMKDVSRNVYSGIMPYSERRQPQIATLVKQIDLPRATSKADVKMAKKNLIMLVELERNEVSR